MSRLAQACLVAALAAAGAAHAQESAMADDPYQWLEEVAGEKPLEWVRGQNAQTDAALASTVEFKRLEAGIREVTNFEFEISTSPEVKRIYWIFILKLRIHCFRNLIKDFLAIFK